MLLTTTTLAKTNTVVDIRLEHLSGTMSAIALPWYHERRLGNRYAFTVAGVVPADWTANHGDFLFALRAALPSQGARTCTRAQRFAISE